MANRHGCTPPVHLPSGCIMDASAIHRLDIDMEGLARLRRIALASSARPAHPPEHLGEHRADAQRHPLAARSGEGRLKAGGPFSESVIAARLHRQRTGPRPVGRGRPVSGSRRPGCHAHAPVPAGPPTYRGRGQCEKTARTAHRSRG